MSARVEVDQSGLFVRASPLRSDANKVLLLARGTTVTVACSTVGEAVPGTFKSSSTWDWLWSPVVGYVPDAYVDTPSAGPNVASCGASPPQPPTPPGFAGVRRIVRASPGLLVRPSPDINSGRVGDVQQGSDVTAICTLPGSSVDGSGGTELWDRVNAPVAGFVADRYLTAVTNARVPAC